MGSAEVDSGDHRISLRVDRAVTRTPPGLALGRGRGCDRRNRGQPAPGLCRRGLGAASAGALGGGDAGLPRRRPLRGLTPGLAARRLPARPGPARPADALVARPARPLRGSGLRGPGQRPARSDRLPARRPGHPGRAPRGAALFGIGHSLNVLTTSASPLAVVYQVISAGLVGILFGTVRIRTGMIWPSVIVHALVDWASFSVLYPQISPREPKPVPAIAGLAVYGVLAAAALWSLRREEVRTQPSAG
ncbi:MAG: CPBP family intramembrane metalloprotease [Chloroflexi bacterium]|nr:MAG: CPBP family intramembrane metalloprotease [Chloroflexota bacterium]